MNTVVGVSGSVSVGCERRKGRPSRSGGLPFRIEPASLGEAADLRFDAECPPYTATASSTTSTSHSFWHFRHFRYAPRVLFDFDSAPT